MKNNRRIKIVLAALIFQSVVTVALAFIIRPFLGMALHDSNFQAFDSALNDEQRIGIFTSVGGIVMIYILLLVVSNALWIAGALYLLFFKKGDVHNT